MSAGQGDKERGRQGEGENESLTLPLSPSLILVFALILVVAATFRFYGLAWDGGYLFHPDERKILLVASDLRLPSPLEFFSTDSPLNPKFFAYGSFPIYLLKLLGVFAPPIQLNVPWREDFVSLALMGRVLSVLFDLGTLVMTFLLARRLYDATVGLLASACIAVTVLHIQLAHFYAVDTLLTLLVVTTMYFAARFAQTGARRDAFATGMAFGLAMATKVSALPLVVPMVVAVLKSQRRERESGRQGEREKILPVSPSPRLPLRNWLNQLWSTRAALARILAVALAAFIVTQPYALLDPVRYFGQVGTESLVARGWLDYPYTRQYADTLPFIYPMVQSTVWGMGVPLGIFAWLASALFVWRWWRTREWRDGFILSWALVYFLIVGGQYAKHLRYLLPLLPFLFLMAASALKVPGSRFQVSHFTHHVLRVAYFVVLFASFVYSLAFVGIYSREHPWLTISKWIYANIPTQSTLAIEHWDDALPVPIRAANGERAPTEYHIRVLPMYDADDDKKLDALVDTLSSSDYIILATQRLSSTITRLPQRYPVSARYYRLLFDGALGFDLASYAMNNIELAGIAIMDERFEGVRPAGIVLNGIVLGRADESFTVYDHPMPLVFKKTRGLSRDELRARLSP